MASTRVNLRQAPVGSAAWISEERNSAQQWADTEAEGFTFAAHNEMEWLNEHMSEIFSKNESKFADIFKTPGKLRGKTPRTARKLNPLEAREPLSNVFSATPRGGPSPFRQTQFERQISTFRVAEDEPVKHQPAPLTKHASPRRPINTLDSGYHGSQSDDGTEVNDQDYEQEAHQSSPRVSPAKSPGRPLARSPDEHQSRTSEVSEERRTTEGSFESAREEPTKVLGEEAEGEVERGEEMETESTTEEPAMVSYPVLESPIQSRIPRCSTPRSPSPQKRSPQRPVIAARSPSKAPSKSPSKSPMKQTAHPNQELEVDGEDEHMEDVQSPSDASSPIRPIVRKSSLNFASLPAREPITTKKSIGNRASRTSHLDQTRTSYYGRQTGGKSLGNARPEKDDDDEMDVDSAEDNKKSNEETNWARLHNKTSTQRLQDQISMLGQSQSNFRPHSKSIASNSLAIAQASQSTQPSQETQQQKSPLRKDRSFVAPGAFPEDEDESWIGPPTTGAAVAGPSIFSPRLQLAKSYTADVMESIHGKDSIGGAQFTVPKRGSPMRQISPIREPVADTSMSPLRHIKSVSASFLRSPKKSDDSISLNSVKKGISVSNPNPSTSSLEESTTPPKSPSRSRGSPLKAAKDKFSSILKTSRGLFASSAAVSAEAKNAALSPGYERPHTTSSMDEVFEDGKELTYPSLENHMNDAPQQTPASPTKSPRRTRASTEREEKRKEDAKEAKRILDQLEKARMKVQEEARQHRLEQERVMAMEKQILARKEQENLAKSSQVDVPRATRSSPRKTKAQLEAEGIAASAAHTEDMASNDTELGNAPVAMPPPSIPRPKSQIGRPGVKRPLKPTKDTLPKTKAPTVIRVDTGSQRGHQYHPSTASLASSLQDSLPTSTTTSQSTLRNKQSTASNASFQSKSSTSSFKSTASKALEAAAKKKEQDELVAQRKREAKMEIERQRAAIKEEERRQKEQDRRQEAERQRELQREKEQALMTAEAKRQANRQAMDKKRMEMEKAKQTRAPPPASRNQPSTDISRAALQDKALPPIPPQRGDLGRSVNANIHNTSKAPPKRPLQQDNGDDHHSRPQLIRNGPSYQQNQADSKRRKTSDAFDDDDTTENQPRMMAPPIRQSSVRQKEMPTKSLFPSGYANAPPPASSLPRNTLISQHNGNPSKPAHPMDMTQVSKATINFAPSSSQPSTQSHKTPARPPGTAGSSKSHAKSAAKSSPRYQNGESIDLPEIHTDSEDEDEDEKDEFAAPGWTNSPLLKKQLIKQETIDPMDVFGPPGPLIMEEVFSKNKERFPKFRARTSSANWSGQDRLTEDEIRRDLEARDRVRRQGGWTYDSMV